MVPTITYETEVGNKTEDFVDLPNLIACMGEDKTDPPFHRIQLQGLLDAQKVSIFSYFADNPPKHYTLSDEGTVYFNYIHHKEMPWFKSLRPYDTFSVIMKKGAKVVVSISFGTSDVVQNLKEGWSIVRIHKRIDADIHSNHKPASMPMAEEDWEKIDKELTK